MSAKASPWQNGHKESFYSGFKLELGHPECEPTLEELIEALARQIHYYNNQRIHTALKCPPAVFSQRITLQKSKVENYFSPQLIYQEIAERQFV
jgi:transposase InsO family protein